MILRLWHGWTAQEDANAYERLVVDEVFPDIAAESSQEYRGAEPARRTDGDTVEFITILRFGSWEAVESFAGPDPEQAHIPPAVRKLLVEFDDRVTHYEVCHDGTGRRHTERR